MAEEAVQTDVEETEAAPEETTAEATVEKTATEIIREQAAAEKNEQPVVDDWRAAITDPKLRDMAGRFTSPADAVKMAADLRTQLSKAPPAPPGKDASEDDVKAYLKKIGVPEGDYEFPVPEGHTLSDEERAFRSEASELFRNSRIPQAAAVEIAKWFDGKQSAAREAMRKAQEDAATQADAALRKEWPGKEYETNTAIAGQAWQRFGGSEFLEDIKLEGGGRLGDHPGLLKMFAQIGRATMETAGMLGMSESDAKDLQSQHAEAIRKALEASDRGDRDEAARWTEKGDALAGKIWGHAPAAGQAA